MKKITSIMLVALIAASFTACAKNKKAVVESTPLDAKEVASAPVQPARPVIFTKEQIEKKDAEIKTVEAKMNTCKVTSDCEAVYPDCCGVSKHPFFVNKKNVDKFTSEYKRIYEQTDCGKVTICTMAYFGGAKADCISGKCARLMPK